jgi:HEAT repeat protein
MSIALKDKVTRLIGELGGPETESVLCALRNLPGEAVEPLACAFRVERDDARRTLIVEAIWQLRDECAVPVLLEALTDPHSGVWKEALDGLVTLGGAEATAGLETASSIVAGLPDMQLRLEWCQEALDQIRERGDSRGGPGQAG